NGADEKLQAQYYFVSGNVYSDLAKKGDASAFDDAVSSYQKVIEIEKSGRNKYSDEAQAQLKAMTVDLVNGAVKDNNEKKYKEAADKLYLSYKLSPRDTVYLYYAAGSSVSGHNYEDALKYYNELKDLGYDGSEKKYTAVNVESGKVEEMDKT